MYPYTVEFTDCLFCGEKIEAGHRRCPYCAGIQPRKKRILPEQINPGAEFQSDLNPEFGAQPEVIAGPGFAEQPGVIAGPGFVLINPETGAQGESKIAPEPAAEKDEASAMPEDVAEKAEGSAMPEDNDPAQGTARASYPMSESKQKPKKPMGNGKKVLLTLLAALVPVLGPIIGLAVSAIYMSSADDDRASFGSALFKASVILSLLGFVAAFVVIVSLLT